jgi:hypothetical protein
MFLKNMFKRITYFRKLIQILKHSVFVSWILYTSIYVSLIIYYWFYTWYLPQANIESNIMFELQYSNSPQGKKQYELLGSVDLFNRNGQILSSGQEYSFILELTVPESDSNFEIGIFGISADLLDTEEKTISSFKTTVYFEIFY